MSIKEKSKKLALLQKLSMKINKLFWIMALCLIVLPSVTAISFVNFRTATTDTTTGVTAYYGSVFKLNYHACSNNITNLNFTGSNMKEFVIWENRTVRRRNGTCQLNGCAINPPFIVNPLATNLTIVQGNSGNAWTLGYKTTGMPKLYPTSLFNITTRASGANGGTVPSTLSVGEIDGVFGIVATNLTSTCSVADTTKPVVFDKFPRNSTIYNITNKIRIAVNVTDAGGVSQVRVNITRAGGNITKFRLLLSTTDRYNRTFTIPNVTGLYNVSFFANDTSNNKNNTIKTQFIVSSGIAWNQTQINRTVEWGSALNVRLNASSQAVDILRYRVNDTTRFLFNSITGKLQNNSAFPRLNTYFIRITANNSQLFNVSSIIKITVNDSTKPLVKALNITPRLVEYNSSFAISANITDLHSIKISNVTLNTSTFTKNYTLVRTGTTNVHNKTIEANFKRVGKFTARVRARDNSSNENNTVIFTFRINDSIKPKLNITYPLLPIFQFSRNRTFIFQTSDSYDVSNVTLWVWNRTGRYNKTVAKTRPFINFTLLSIPEGEYTWYINSTDNSTNRNQSKLRNLTIDRTSTSITKILVNSITMQSAVINYNTSEFSMNETITYGTYPNTGNMTQSTQSFTLTKTHSILIASMQPSTIYYYNITSIDRAGNVKVNASTFTTSLSTGGDVSGGGGGGTVTETTTPITAETILNDAIITFVNDKGAGYTQEDLIALQEQLQANDPPIDLTLDTLKIYVDSRLITGYSAPSGGGGAEAPPVIYIKGDGTAYVIATVPEGSGSYTMLASLGQTREKKIQLYNLGSVTTDISLSCDDTSTEKSTTGFCNNVEISSTSVSLPANEKQKKLVSVQVTLPYEFSEKRAYFQIITKDAQGDLGRIGFEVKVSELGSIFGLWDKAVNEKYLVKLSDPNYKLLGLRLGAEGRPDINIPKGVPAIVTGGLITGATLTVLAFVLPSIPPLAVLGVIVGFIIETVGTLWLIP